MCFGSASKYEASPAPTATPYAATPAPSPSAITPTQITAQTKEERRKKIAQVKYGLMSTIKTSPQGISGAGANLSGEGQGKSKLGE